MALYAKRNKQIKLSTLSAELFVKCGGVTTFTYKGKQLPLLKALKQDFAKFEKNVTYADAYIKLISFSEEVKI